MIEELTVWLLQLLAGRSDVKALGNKRSEICVNKQWGQWAGEYFVWNTEKALELMKERIDAMSKWKCDMFEADNMDWFTDDAYSKYFSSSQPRPSKNAAKSYISSLCSYAKKKNVGCVAKNAGQSVGAGNW